MPNRCGSATGELPDGVVELSWDDGATFSDITQQTWEIDGQLVRDLVLNESVRFDLQHPARIYGFAVQWSDLPMEMHPDTKIAAGLYPDFGHNGFDFWPEPLWEGTRCLGDIQPEQWTSYVLDTAVEVPHPGLIYVSHLRRTSSDPAFTFDETYVSGECSLFSDCHSAINFPEMEAQSYFNGVTVRMPHDYMVRLYVEYLDDLSPEETFFRETTGNLVIGDRHAWGDYDDDGDDDLFTAPSLLRNDSGIFTDVTVASGLDEVAMGGGIWGDYDNDGCLDLFVFAESTLDGDSLWHSDCDGTFSDMTEVAGIADLQDYNLCAGDPAQNHQPSPAAAWLDIDADGWLDLYVVDFICWTDHDFYVDQVFRNQTDGSFAVWHGTHGFSAAAYSGRGAAPVDYDQDGDVDLWVNNYSLQRNLFFRNNGDGTVTDIALGANLAGHQDPRSGAVYYGHTIGTAWGDLDGDGDFDAIEANLAHPRFFDFSDKTRVLLNENGVFFDLSGDWTYPSSAAGLRYQETHSVPVLADFDNDGALDLALSAVYDGRPTDFYWGNGDGTFRLDAYHAGITVTNGWGMATTDWDQDGDLDLAARGALFENTREDSGHWLQIRAIGNVSSNWGAYGATVRVYTSQRVFLRHVQGGTGQGCQDSAYLHFGLGEVSQVARIEIDFPASGLVSFPGPYAVDQRWWLFEDGTAASGWTPPWQ